MTDDARRRLSSLRDGLIHLHKVLLDSEAAAYERNVARITSRGQLLELVLRDPWFAGLHELSKLVAMIDETLEDKDPDDAADAGALMRQARELLMPNEAGSGFRKRYFEALQRDPNVVMAHAEMKKLFHRL